MLVINCTVMIFLILLVIETIDRCDSQALLWQEDRSRDRRQNETISN
jgi:hypothetical protein